MGPFQLTSMAYIVQPNRKKRGSLDIVVLLLGYWTPLHGFSALFCIHLYPSIYAIDVLFFFSFLVFAIVFPNRDMSKMRRHCVYIFVVF
jgi:hypothetical protein